MKKLISVMLVLALCAVSCAFAQAMDVTGTWYLNVIESEGVQLDPAMLGSELILTLNADGSAELESFGESGFAVWHMENGNVIIAYEDGEAMTACPDSGNLVIDDQEIGMTMILGREKQALQSYVPAQLVADPTMQQFEGSWNAVLIDLMGMQMPLDALDMKLVVEIAGSSAVVTHIEGEENTSYTAPIKLEGNVLTVKAVDDQMPMALHLQQDGKMVYTEETEGLAMIMYFEKTA